MDSNNRCSFRFFVKTCRAEHHQVHFRDEWVCRQPARKLDAVHAGHVPIQKNYVKSLALHSGGVQHLKGLSAVFRAAVLHFPCGCLVAQYLPVCGVVVHDQNPHSTKVFRRKQAVVFLSGPACKADSKPEGGTLALFTFHAHFATHQIYQPAGDG